MYNELLRHTHDITVEYAGRNTNTLWWMVQEERDDKKGKKQNVLRGGSIEWLSIALQAECYYWIKFPRNYPKHYIDLFSSDRFNFHLILDKHVHTFDFF